jgi:hypothetical protein
MRLFLAGEEDWVVEVAKRVNPGKRDRRNLYGMLAENGYGENSFPSTS